MTTTPGSFLVLTACLGLTGLGCGDTPPPGNDTSSDGDTDTSTSTNTSASTNTSTSGGTVDGGSGGSAGSTSSTTGVPPGPNYYPLVDGTTRVFRHTSRGGWDETIVLEAMGDGRFIESESGDPDGERTETVLEIDEQGRVFRTSKQEFEDDELALSVVYEPGFIRFDPAWLDLAPGQSVSMEYERTETPAGEPADPSRPRSHRYTSLGLETVTVLGKTYRDCLVIERERTYSDVVGEPEDQKKRFYLAPNVGKIWEVNLDSGNTEELVSSTP